MDRFIKSVYLLDSIEKMDNENNIKKKQLTMTLPGTVFKEFDKRCKMVEQSRSKAMAYILLGYMDDYFEEILSKQFEVNDMLHNNPEYKTSIPVSLEEVIEECFFNEEEAHNEKGS